MQPRDLDTPAISILREEEEETPPPDAPFSKFRVSLARGAGAGPRAADSDEEEEEDQLIDDDDELAIVAETGRAPASSPLAHPSTHRGRQRGSTGRRGRPGREPPDAAAMMSTFELARTDLADTSPPPIVPPPPPLMAAPQPAPGPSAASTRDWSSAPPPRAPRRKPGPKKGSTLGPRGPRKPR